MSKTLLQYLRIISVAMTTAYNWQVCVCVRPIKRQTDRWTNGRTDGQRDGWTDTQTDI
jgi:hypothetical protein